MADASVSMAAQYARRDLKTRKRYRSKYEPGTCLFKRYEHRGTLAGTVWVPRQWLACILDQGSGLMVVLHFMATPNTLIVMCTSISSVLLFVYFLPHLSMNLTWTAVSFILIFPLQNSIKDAYRRREAALQSLSDFRATLLQVLMANALWDWPGSDGWYGRAEDNVPKESGGKGMKAKSFKDTPLPEAHTQRVHDLMRQLIDVLQDLLLVPRRGRSRQEYCTCISGEREFVEHAEKQGRAAVLALLSRLHGATEDLKAAGMPANEASRINQYNMFLCRDFERLWSHKTYRTVTSLRAVTRVTIQILPFLYGPYYVHIARSTSTGELTLATLLFACLFSVTVSLLMVAMLNIAVSLENPFRPDCIDTIRVRSELELCREGLAAAVKQAEETWHERLVLDWEIVAPEDSLSLGESSEEEEDDEP